MSWRIVLILKPCRLSLKNNQLIYSPNDEFGNETKIPLEDISSIIIETEQTTITSRLLSEIAENNISIITTNSSHTPNGIFLPYMQYYKQTEIAFLQQEWTEPFKKKLWQKIIQQKILNSSYVIKGEDKDLYKHLNNLSKNVLSGDTTNIEAQAAKKYWEVFYPNFRRNSNTKVNSALNYGYSILRSIIAKNLSARGFVGCFGVHHCNKDNPFNLADDIIEPFRAFVDYRIKNIFLIDSNDDSLTPVEKQKIIEIMFFEVSYDKQNYSILYTIELFVENLINISRTKDLKKLTLPEFPK